MKAWFKGKLDASMETSVVWKAVAKRELLDQRHVVLATERFLGEAGAVSEEHPTTRLGDVADYVRGLTYGKGDESELPTVNAVLRAQNVSVEESRLVLDDLRYLRPDFEGSPEKRLRADDILVCSSSGSKAHMGKVAFVPSAIPFFFGGFMGVLRSRREFIEPRFLFRLLTSQHHKTFLAGLTEGANINNLKLTEYLEYEIPLPPLEEQRRIVVEIEGYQKVLDGARQILAGYKPQFEAEPDWPMAELRSLTSISSGGTPSKANADYWTGTIPWVSAKDMKTPQLSDAQLHVSESAIKETATELAPKGSVLVLVRGMGLANGVPICELLAPCAFNQDIKALRPTIELSPAYFAAALRREERQLKSAISTAAHGTLKIETDRLLEIEIPLPPLDEQRRLVAELDAEAAQMDSVRALLPRFEAKIQRVLDRVWGSSEPE